MIIDFLLALKENVDRHGVRWGVVFALYAVFRKERRNYRLDRRDERHNAYFEAILHNERIIMEKLGVGPCADISSLTTKSSAHRGAGGFMYYWVEKFYARFVSKFTLSSTRRKSKMASLLSGKKKIGTFILLVLINGLNDTLQLHLTPQTISNVSMLGGGYIVIEGILDIARSFVNRFPQTPQQPPADPNKYIQG